MVSIDACFAVSVDCDSKAVSEGTLSFECGGM